MQVEPLQTNFDINPHQGVQRWASFCVHKNFKVTRMQHNEYGYVCSTEAKIFSDLERWLADKKNRERRAKQHGAFNMQSKDDKIKRRCGDM